MRRANKSALIIVDMQNDFVHPEGGIAFRAAENPAQASTYHSYRAPYLT